MNARERVRHYAQQTGLTQRKIALYRTTPISGWTTRRDRQIGGLIRSLERMFAELEGDVDLWLRASAKLLDTLERFVRGAIETAVAFAERVVEVVEKINVWLEGHPGVQAALETLLLWIAGRAARRALPA